MHKNLLKAISFITFCLFLTPAIAQNVLVTGKVTDAVNGSPIGGASVSIKGITAETVTDGNGQFRLALTGLQGSIMVTDVYHKPKEVVVTGSSLNISLAPADTVISFGYGSQRKSDVTGAVSLLPPENFNRGAIFNPADQLAGKIAGLTVTEAGGDPNQIASISLRGQTSFLGNLSPLFVVDGVILDNSAQFQNIPPGDIASYTILKDVAAAAIYGSRGANGVIIVTTKKGEKGHPVITYDGLAGVSVQSKYYDLLNASEYLAAAGADAQNKGANTDWQKAVNRTAYQQRHYVSLSGGSNAIAYVASANYQDQEGIIQNNGKQQLGLHFSGELKTIGDKLDIKAGIQYINTTRKLLDYSALSFVFNTPPTFPVKNPDGSYFTYTDFAEANPVEHIDEEMLRQTNNLSLINTSVDYSITHNLKVGVLGTATLDNTKSNGYVPSFPIEGNLVQTTNSNEDSHSYTGNIHINYDKNFGKSSLSVLGSYEYNHYAYNFDYVDNSANVIANGTSEITDKLTSFIGRAAYSYNNRLFATAILREDGFSTSVFDKPHASYPSVGVAYVLKKDVPGTADWLSGLKLKAGYGITGNSKDNGGGPLPEFEKRQGGNVGLDFSLFNGRVSGDVNYFNDKSRNLLYNYPVPVPPFITSTLLTNFVALANKGVEVSLSGKIISGRTFSWSANGQITFLTTTIANINGVYNYNGKSYPLTIAQIPVGYAEGRGISANPIVLIKAGTSPFEFFLPHYTGVNAQGYQTFDGQTIAENPVPAGHYIDPSPKFNYGVTNNFNYGSWNLNFALLGVYGQKIFNNTLLNIETVTRLPGNNVTREALTNGVKDEPIASDRWLEGASYLRLDNAALGYSFKNVSFASLLRVFIAANNLFVLTKYRGYDPEVRTAIGYSNSNVLFGANTNGSQNQPYIDNNYNGKSYYPKSRTFSLGVNVSLK